METQVHQYANYPHEEASLVTDWISVIDANNYILELLQTEEVWKRVETIAQSSRTINLNLLEQDFISAGVIIATQNIANSSKEHGRSIGQSDYLTRTDVPHLQPTYVVNGQVGMLKDLETQRSYIYDHIDDCVKTGLRAAYQIHDRSPPPGVTDLDSRIAYAKACSWLPSSQQRGQWDNILRVYHQQYLDQNHDYIIVPPDTPMLSGAAPPWLAHLPEAEREDLEWMFNALPNTDAEWVNLINSIPAGFRTALRLTRPVDAQGAERDFVLNDFKFHFNFKDFVGNFISKWKPSSAIMEPFFQMSGRNSLVSLGSLSTRSRTSYHDGLFEYRCEIRDNASSASLNACFPIKQI